MTDYSSSFLAAVTATIGTKGHPELGWEGGYENDPRDPGGETNLGIDKKDHPDEDIKHMTWDRAVAIYYDGGGGKSPGYWLPSRCEEMPAEVGSKVFDLAVNCGRGSASRMLQDCCNHFGAGLKVDGATGPKTLAAVNQIDPINLHMCLRARAELHYRALAGFPIYGRGWLTRNAAR